MALLAIRNVNHFFGGLRAVNGFNLDLEDGEFLGLIGPNGAGKTTVFNLVSGFYSPTEGEILFQGKNISGLRPHAVTSLGLARTFQNIRLWNSMTVFENLCISQHCRLGYGFLSSILWTKKFRKKEKAVFRAAEEMLDILQLKDCAGEYPKNLAYGLQRRVEIGRALAARPRLLMLDEPAAGMNPTEIEQLIDLIKWIREEFKLTIWLIEHQMKVVMSLCERIMVLDFGATIAEGLPSEVRNNRHVIKAYLGD
ncbi:MAG: ABC transporter ATP-binding protein [Nitrospirota bacterium]|nr:ABC transporter ATP-binding protein [Nitrospirota bacterium]